MASPINRKNHKDAEKTILLTDDLERWGKQQCFELDISFSAYVRGLILRDKREKLEALSQQKQANNSGVPNVNHGSPSGLLNVEQVAQILQAAMKWNPNK